MHLRRCSPDCLNGIREGGSERSNHEKGKGLSRSGLDSSRLRADCDCDILLQTANLHPAHTGAYSPYDTNNNRLGIFPGLGSLLVSGSGCSSPSGPRESLLRCSTYEEARYRLSLSQSVAGMGERYRTRLAYCQAMQARRSLSPPATRLAPLTNSASLISPS